MDGAGNLADFIWTYATVISGRVRQMVKSLFFTNLKTDAPYSQSL
jgi:hypothetical protein